MEKKLALAHEKGVKTVLVITKDIQAMLAENRRKLLGPSVVIGNKVEEGPELANSLFISSNIAKDIIGNKEKKSLKPERSVHPQQLLQVMLPLPTHAYKIYG